MKKATKFFWSLLIIVAAATAVFFIGWVSFYVKPNTCSVMSTKTGGLYEKPVEHGKFLWRWERILPTNATLTNYKLTGYSVNKTFTGTLPSANVYRIYVSPNPDFSYEVQVIFTLNLTPQAVLKAVRDGGVGSQEELDTYVNTKCQSAAQKVTDYLIMHKPESIQFLLTEDEVKEIFQKDSLFTEDFKIENVLVMKCKLPDLEIYERAKQSFTEYQKELDMELKAKAEAQASLLVEENRTMAQLERFAEILKKYPELQEFTKHSDINNLMNTIRNLR